MADDLSDLASFLADERPGMRAAAAELLAGLSGSDEGVLSLAPRASQLAAPLLRLLGKGDAERGPACAALVNLCGEARWAAAALAAGAVDRACELLREPGCAGEDAGRLLALVQNVTREAPGQAALLLNAKPPPLRLLRLALLLRHLGGPPGASPWSPAAAGCLANAAACAPGRLLMADAGCGAAPRLCALLADALAPPAARLGAALAVANMCADAAAQPAALAAAPSLPAALLAPLAPGAGCDPELRRACARGCAALACSEGADALLRAGGRDALAAAYEREEAPDVCEELEQAAAGLIAHGGVAERPAPAGGG